MSEQWTVRATAESGGHWLARHDSSTGEVVIYSAHRLDAEVFRASGAEWIGTEGVRRFHDVYDAVRTAEGVAHAAGVRMAVNNAREALRALARAHGGE